MRRLVFAIMVLFVIFSLLKGFAEAGDQADKVAAGQRTEQTSL